MRGLLVLALAVTLVTGCTRPRRGLYTAGGGAGIMIGGVAIGLEIDRGSRAPDDGFVVAAVSVGVGATLIGVGLIWALVLHFEPRIHPDRSPSGRQGVGWQRAVELGDQAKIAATAGDCARARTLAADARTADEDYYDRVLALDPAISACAR